LFSLRMSPSFFRVWASDARTMQALL